MRESAHPAQASGLASEQQEARVSIFLRIREMLVISGVVLACGRTSL